MEYILAYIINYTDLDLQRCIAEVELVCYAFNTDPCYAEQFCKEKFEREKK